MQQKKLLILGAGHADTPLINASKRLGYFVITSSNRSDDPGHALGDIAEHEDFSDVDAISGLVQKHEVEHVFAGCNDFAAVTAAAVSEKHGLKGNDTVQNNLAIHHKDKFRQTLEHFGYPSPKTISILRDEVFGEKSMDLKFPVMVKPVDLTGGKGILKVENAEGLEQAIALAFEKTRQDYVVVEEFIEGSHHSVSCIIQGSKVAFSFVADEYFFKNPYLVAGAATSSDQNSAHALDAIRQIDGLASNLKLADGLIHAQYIASEDGVTFLLDVSRRPPGDFFVNLVSRSTKVDYSAMIVGVSLEHPDFQNIYERQAEAARPVVRHCAMPDQNGVFESLELSEAFANALQENNILIEPEEVIDNFENQKPNILIAEFANFSELGQVVRNIQNHVKVRVRN